MIRPYVSVEFHRVVRSTGFVMGLVMPAVMYLVMSRLDMSVGGDHDASLYVMVSMAVYGAVSSALLVGLAVVQDRAGGWLRQLHLTPLSSRDIIVGRSLIGMVVGLPAIVLVCALGRFIGHVELPTDQWLWITVTLWVGTLPFVLLGLAVGYAVSIQAAQAVSTVMNLLLSVVGGLWVPSTEFPGMLKTISEYVPTAAMANLGRNVAFGGGLDLKNVAILAAWTAIFAAGALFAFRRTSQRVSV